MRHERGRSREQDSAAVAAAAPVPPKIGAVTRVQAYAGELRPPAGKVGASSLAGQLGDGELARDVHAAAVRGMSGAGTSLPYRDTIQHAFGRHDISGVQAHTDGAAQAASRAMGAQAYATGGHVAFDGAPSLHTAAHEAAHVIQQRAGVQFKGGVGAAGDAHEQHADAVADLVVQGRSAEPLLDAYRGTGGTAAVQHKAGDPAGQAAPQIAPQAGPQPTAAADHSAIIQKLERMLLPVFFGISEGTFSVEGVTAWIESFARTLGEARTAAAAAPSPELTQAVDRCLAFYAPEMGDVAGEVRAACVQLTNDSSVAKQDPAKAVFPTQDQARRLGAAAAQCNALARDAALPAGEPGKTALSSASATAQDAALAMLQSLSVVSARERWKTGTSTQTPSAASAGTGARTEIDDIFKDAGWSDRVNKDDNGRVFDWCGMFVVSSQFQGAGLARQLRAGFYHTDNVQDFFKYEQKHNAGRAPKSIWAEGQWWNLHDYHVQRGTPRRWTPRATIQAALAAGGTGDIRPGDTCLIDHKGGDSPSHIVMVESYDPATKQLVTIEGNTFGIHADKDGKAERLDDDHLKKSTQGSGTAAGVHVRDMRQLALGPGSYVVNAPDAFVREDDDLTRYKLDDNKKKIALAVGSSVEVTEIKESAGTKYAHLADGGWTRLSNLGTTAKAPSGGYNASSGATVWGVGRPSMVDFEDGHDYAVNDVPAELVRTSPAEIRELAKHKDKQGAAARKVDVKK